MGTFTFRDKSTGEDVVMTMSISDAEAFVKANPHMDWLCGAPLLHSGRGMKKPEDGFRDVLRDIKKRNAGADGINTF